MIDFSHVTKYYDSSIPILNDVSLSIDKGEFVFLSGSSGAGKTTLLKHIFMEEIPSQGTVEVCGFKSHSGSARDIRKIQKNVPYLRRKIGIVFQDMRLLYDRNVFENVAFALRITNVSERVVKKKVYDVLSKTGVAHKCNHLPNQLSGGEQQRVCIARAIVNSPDIVLADEPTGNLDESISYEIFSLLKTINSWGTTILMVTHNSSFIMNSHFRHLHIQQGRLIEPTQVEHQETMNVLL